MREVEIQKLVTAIQNHLEGGNDLNELRVPLEATLGMTLEDYATAVSSSLKGAKVTSYAVVPDSYDYFDDMPPFSQADQKLAGILKLELATYPAGAIDTPPPPRAV